MKEDLIPSAGTLLLSAAVLVGDKDQLRVIRSSNAAHGGVHGTTSVCPTNFI